jgi:hypothetical protein
MFQHRPSSLKENVSMETTTVRRSPAETATGPDPSWKDLYRAGSVSVALYIVLGIIAPAVLFWTAGFNLNLNGTATLQYIASHRSWWIIVQTLTLGPSIFAIVAFAALGMALKGLNKSYVVIGTLGAIVSQILYLAYFPIVLGLVHLSDQYAATTSTGQRAAIASAAEGLIAQNSAVFPATELVFAASILVLSLVMLKGVFHKSIGYLGIATFAVAVVGVSLLPVLGVAYLWWWAFFLIWFLAVGWKLYRVRASGK